MLRDSHKDLPYFQSKQLFFKDTLKKKLEKEGEIKDENKKFYYQNQIILNESLFKIGYSKGDNIFNLFPYYLSSLEYLAKIASEGIPFYRAVDIFALAVLYAERKDEFIEDLQSIYNQMDRTDDLIEFYAAYLFHGTIVPYHSILEYQNMIDNSFESVQRAQSFWYYTHSDAPWYGSHQFDNRGYYGYWSFDTAATCKVKGIYDERLKELDYFPYDLLVQK